MSSVDEMLVAAMSAMKKAYAPYSKFRVGVCIRAGNELFLGCNVENASYPEGNCAEASAIAAMVMAGHHRIDDIVVVSSGDDPCPPCGGCRQRIAEFAVPATQIHVCTQNGVHRSYTMMELLPASFSKGHLG